MLWLDRKPFILYLRIIAMKNLLRIIEIVIILKVCIENIAILMSERLENLENTFALIYD